MLNQKKNHVICRFSNKGQNIDEWIVLNILLLMSYYDIVQLSKILTQILFVRSVIVYEWTNDQNHDISTNERTFEVFLLVPSTVSPITQRCIHSYRIIIDDPKNMWIEISYLHDFMAFCRIRFSLDFIRSFACKSISSFLVWFIRFVLVIISLSRVWYFKWFLFHYQFWNQVQTSVFCSCWRS